MSLTYTVDSDGGKWNLTEEKTDLDDNQALLPNSLPSQPVVRDTSWSRLRTDHQDFVLYWMHQGQKIPGTNQPDYTYGESRVGGFRGALEKLYAVYLGRKPSETSPGANDGEYGVWRNHLITNYDWKPGTGMKSPDGTGVGHTNIDKNAYDILRDGIALSDEREAIDKIYGDNALENEKRKAASDLAKKQNEDDQKDYEDALQTYQDTKDLNERITADNAKNKQTNIDNTLKNAAYYLLKDKLAPNSKQGYYVDERSRFDTNKLTDGTFFASIIDELTEIARQSDDPSDPPLIGENEQLTISQEGAEQLRETLEAAFRDFYVIDKLDRWDPKRGAQPPYADYLINKDVDILYKALNGEQLDEEETEKLEQYKEADKDNFLEKFDPIEGSREELKDFVELSGLTTTGGFDAVFYSTKQAPNIIEAWKKAEEIDDVDIVERYGGADNFYWAHYTNEGRKQGLRGNAAEETAQANAYQETTADRLDVDIARARDLQLGFEGNTLTDRLFEIQIEDENGNLTSIVEDEWKKARRGDPYWKELAINNYLDVEDRDQFAALFRLSEEPLFKSIVFQVNQTPVKSGGITDLEQAVQQAAGEKAQVDAQKFGALNQAILKDTIEEMKKQRAEQETLSFYKGFNTFSEIFDMNKTLADSILGDSGVGGILSFTSAGKAEEDLLKNLNELSGVRNSVQYNWTRWFDEAIKEKYGIDYSVFEPLEEQLDVINAFTDEKTTGKVWNADQNTFDQDFLDRAGFKTTEDLITFLEEQGDQGADILTAIQGDPGDETKSALDDISSNLKEDIKTIEEQKDRGLVLEFETDDKVRMMNIEAEFARRYIDNYLTPRFDTSRSMDEFVEYLDVRQEEKNPFQTQDTYSALQDLAQLRSNQYLDRIREGYTGPRSFDFNWYFDPVGDPSNQEEYDKQTATVKQDWENAKAGDDYWNAQAYRFGIDINDKEAFARMHFEVKGQGEGFDPAEDYINAGKVRNFIFEDVFPRLEEEAKKGDSVFGQFITPEEFADEMLRGLDPSNTPAEWQELLQRYGLEGFEGEIEELREYIIEILRTGSAQKIREEIKYLNEKRQRPTQEILGVTYIQRDEDFKDEKAKPTTQLYSTFQKAGYEGTEDEFYEKFFPDLDRSEQITLTKAGQDEALKTYGLDLSDPFASFGTIESFFPEDAKEARKEAEEESPAEKYTSYFRIGVDDDEDEDYMSDTGEEFLSEFTSMFKGLG